MPECIAPYTADVAARLLLCFLRHGRQLQGKLALSLRTLAGFAPCRAGTRTPVGFETIRTIRGAELSLKDLSTL